MKKEDLVYLCTIIGNLSGIPVRLYKDDRLCFHHSVVALPADPVLLDHNEILVPNDHIRFFVTPNFFYYGEVISGAYRIARRINPQTPHAKSMVLSDNITVVGSPSDNPEKTIVRYLITINIMTGTVYTR